ncbi:nitroreductase family deazaflavin-dependent oxidoreductase [Actinomadura sp. KC216]|uniref:nitroreductase family deazaflavin-dependent oxidoreductase n=1 Tax=Actinomadura sp. KC216 TaxID=2530370 RepID=UPI00104760FC|nr:nitroreductase family deazaflavin-dependent oxidoreductase [Actinomadura sp. KC216]TDB86763.1 nitroreductase family deazaflavin-dependent oxidoreductase [Actinomadura sp. KC216]
MPIPKFVARVNRVATNRVTGLFAGRAPGWGIVLHKGRRTGRAHRTPINIFREPGGYVAALTYGPDADWVRNTVAAGGCDLETRGERVRLTDPRIVHDPARKGVPAAVRPILGLIGVNDFLHLSAEEPRKD